MPFYFLEDEEIKGFSESDVNSGENNGKETEIRIKQCEIRLNKKKSPVCL
ncbi:unnamed protein product [marine sediment metagenome]|uniref:Uncharacterized protein n=1 Tax=marine sediment metagenome TaxID=412755 RepID=X1NNA2_9ZZZZ